MATKDRKATFFSPTPWERTVFIGLDGMPDAAPAGILTLYERGIELETSTFVYGQRYRKRSDAIPVDPVALPLVSGAANDVHQPLRGLALFGAIRDAAPDSWGRRVIENRMHAVANALPESTYLSKAGPHRTGALDFRDSPTAPAEAGAMPHANDLEYLLDAADAIQEGEDVPASLQLYFQVGATFGGARPKAVLLDEGRQWVGKFPAVNDRFNVPRIEYATLMLAKACGLAVPELKLISLADGRDVMLIERFDRVPLSKGKYARRHVVSGLTMLGLHESETSAVSYADLADAINVYGAKGRVREDKIELFRRMIFNILVSNDDDHLRNHAFVWDAPSKGWRLSELYDVVPKPQHSQERYLVLGVGKQGRLATLDNALSHAGQFGLAAGDAIAHIHEIAAVVREWRTYFHDYGVNERLCDQVASGFRKPRDIGLERLGAHA